LYGSTDLQQRFTFAFVRNPWDRVVSAYRALLRGGMRGQAIPWRDRYLGQYASFREFVIDWIGERNRVYWHGHFTPQFEFLIDSHGEVAVSYVARFERLETEVEQICQRLGTSCVLRHENRAPGVDYRTYYDEETIQIVRERYAKDIHLFNYTF
jgi:hypothetical protein